MKAFRIHNYAGKVLSGLALTAWLMLPLEAVGAAEARFDILPTKTVTYTNVTVTTKAKDYIFIVHARGMTSLKLAELPADVQQQLGYAVAGRSKGSTNTAAVWAKREMAKLGVPQMKVLGSRLEQKWRGHPPAGRAALPPIAAKLILAVLGALLLVHLFYSYCCMLICRKTGNPPGGLVWVPVLQLIPMLRAAGMSGWWFLAYFVPLLNLVAAILWSLKIAEARGKSVWVGVLLLLPVANLIAFLYLAFSDAVPADDDDGREPKLMSLQAA